ncbi:hypothetical protein [Gehongia tenuis]|uniref:Kazal-like domain-containing protein n=1 Tax=Gehongia tenuis TaxID=2763655 RepID=A0A926HRB7_9FIRM|nr:hypothetical protein [Gehongia tenuis]MBC8532146.1 hypothetical protein [Gehongia tenuis]
MAQVTCSVCQAQFDSRSMQVCPECHAYICNECAKTYGGYCENCYEDEDHFYWRQ